MPPLTRRIARLNLTVVLVGSCTASAAVWDSICVFGASRLFTSPIRFADRRDASELST